jgi:hypothetical protein
MTLQQLKSSLVSIKQTGYGHWKVTFKRYGRELSAVTTNSLAIDRISFEGHEPDRQPNLFFSTVKKAYRSLYDEVIRANS